MAFFKNNTVNLLNLHFSIHALALSGGGAFFFVFLLHAGVPAPGVLATLALILLIRFTLRPLVLVMAKRWGLKPMVIMGSLVTAAQYPMLAQVHGVGWPLAALCVTSAFGDALYWTSYHAYFATLGDAEHRGHQVGAREALAALVGVVGPLATGWALVALGPGVAFGATGLVLSLGALPLLSTPDIRVLAKVPSTPAMWSGAWLCVGDAWSFGGFFVWQIALFQSLGESYTAFGGAMALAALIAAVGGLALGRFIDAGHGGRAVWIACGAYAVCVLLRAASLGHPFWAILANTAGVLVSAFYTPTTNTAIYNQAQNSPCAFRFLMVTEGSWDVGMAAGCLTAAAMLSLNTPMAAAILMSLLGTAVVFVQLRRYYRMNSLMIAAPIV